MGNWRKPPPPKRMTESEQREQWQKDSAAIRGDPVKSKSKPADSTGGSWLSDFSAVIEEQGRRRHEQESARIEALARSMPNRINVIRHASNELLLAAFEQWASQYQSHWRERKLMLKLQRTAKAEILRRMRNG